jgi:hypothetical protein
MLLRGILAPRPFFKIDGNETKSKTGLRLQAGAQVGNTNVVAGLSLSCSPDRKLETTNKRVITCCFGPNGAIRRTTVVVGRAKTSFFIRFYQGAKKIRRQARRIYLPFPWFTTDVVSARPGFRARSCCT